MGMSIRFTRPCFTCGRNLEIPVVHLGREVACSHCGSRFVASTSENITNRRETHNLDERIDRLLAFDESCPKLFRIHPNPHEHASTSTYEV